jgi:hypothetical protein
MCIHFWYNQYRAYRESMLIPDKKEIHGDCCKASPAAGSLTSELRASAATASDSMA